MIAELIFIVLEEIFGGKKKPKPKRR